MMRPGRAAVVLLLILATSALCAVGPNPVPNRPFDEYGAIRWEDEKARLDNFAIQVQHMGEEGYGFIVVYDRTGGCPGEATARAIRAKRYIVEHRGIPWNKVIWRRDGYQPRITTTLLIVPRGATVSYPFREYPVPAVDGPATRTCKARLEGIRRSRW